MTDQVRHIPQTEAAATIEDVYAPRDAHVIIPAKNASGGIDRTIRYLAQKGFDPDHIQIMVNGSTDNTEAVARATDLATVHRQADIIAEHPSLMQTLSEQFGLDTSRWHGKGFAMFCAALVLEDLNLNDTTPVLFLDADLAKLEESNPIGHLLVGWNAWGHDSTFGIVKLAMPSPDVPLMLASLSMFPQFREIGALQFLVCGQVCLRWALLRDMRLATGFAVEVGMLVDIYQRLGMRAFGEVALPVTLTDDAWPERRYTIMMTQIIRFIAGLHGQCHLRMLDSGQINTLNAVTTTEIYLQGRGEGVVRNQLNTINLDGILPAISDLPDIASLRRAG